MKRICALLLIILFLISGCVINGDDCQVSTVGSKMKIKQVAVGDEYSLFLTESGEVYGVGKNYSANLGLGDTRTRYNPEKLNLSEKIKSIGAGEDCAYAISQNGKVFLWGSNLYGQIGVPPQDKPLLPTRLHNGFKIDSIAIGWNHILARSDKGTLYSWGSNEYNALGLGASITQSIIAKPTPVLMDSVTKQAFKYISAGATSSMAVASDGTVYTWGEAGVSLNPKDEGSNTTQTSIPMKLGRLNQTVIKTANGFLFDLILTRDGQVYGRGRNECNQISSKHQQIITSFQLIALPERIIDIVAGTNYALAISKSGKLYAWGNNDKGQLGMEQLIVYKPTQVPIDDQVASVATFSTHTFVTSQNSDIYAMGENRYGQLNNGTQTNTKTPVKIRPLSRRIAKPVHITDDKVLPAAKKLVSLSSGYSMSIAIDEDGKVYTWGSSFLGCLGNGKIDNVARPSQIDFPHKAIQADSNSGVIAILLENGDVYMGGTNVNYRLGDGSQLDRWKPIKIEISKPVKRIFNGQNASFAQTNDNDYYVWGDNSFGVLSTGDLLPHQQPTKIKLPFKAEKISSHTRHSLFLDNTGSAYTWGSWNSIEKVLAFKKLPLNEKVIDIATSTSSNFILTESGKILAWGDNSDGRLGLKEHRVYESPTAVESKQLFKKMAVSPVLGEVVALSNNGSVYTWGYNILHQNGGEYINIPVPVKLSERIVDIYVGDLSAYAISEKGNIYTWGGVINSADRSPLRIPLKMAYSFVK